MKNKNKIVALKSFLIISTLVGLGFYNNAHNGELYNQQLKKSKEWNIGGIYVEDFNDSIFYATSRTDTIYGINYKDKLPDGFGLQKGDLLKIKSTHIHGDTVDINFINLSRNRKIKIWVSIIPFLIVTYFLSRRLIFDKNSQRFRFK